MTTKRRGEYTFHKDLYARAAGFSSFTSIIGGGWLVYHDHNIWWHIMMLGLGLAVFLVFLLAGDLVNGQYRTKFFRTLYVSPLGLVPAADYLEQVNWTGAARIVIGLIGIAYVIFLFGSLAAVPAFIADHSEAKKARRRAKPDNTIVGLLKQGFAFLLGFFCAASGLRVIFAMFQDGLSVELFVTLAVFVVLVLCWMFWSDAQADDMGDIAQFGVVTCITLVAAVFLSTFLVDIQEVLDVIIVVVQIMFRAFLFGLLLNAVIIWRGFNRVVLGKGK